MRLVLAVVVCSLVVAPILSEAFAETDKPAPPDTTSTETLFNPPRVITPEDTASADGEGPAESTGIAPGTVRPKTMQGKGVPGQDMHVKTQAKTNKQRGCAGCSSSERPRFGGGGGPAPGYIFADLGVINAKVREMGIPELSDNVLIVGGKGYARIGRLVIGGAGYGGSTESSGIPDGCARYAEMELAYGGIILGVSLADSRYEATAGMLLGGGSIAVERRRNSRYVVGWNGAWDLFDADDPDVVPTDDLNVSSTIRADFIALEPFIELKYWVLPFMAIDLSASYLRANIEKGEWTIDSVKIPDSPETNIGGPSIKLGIHFGV
jgi:hypothetical protein